MSIVLYTHPVSGHAHRAELMLSLLGLEYTSVRVDLQEKEQKGEAFLRLNAFGQVPVLKDGDIVVPDSNAILVYLASKYDESGSWYPDDPIARARVQRWLSVAAGELARGPAAARLVRLLGAPLDHDLACSTAKRLYRVVDAHLTQQEWLAAEHPTIADVALYSYTAVADQGDVDLAPYSALAGWLERVQALQGFQPMWRAS